MTTETAPRLFTRSYLLLLIAHFLQSLGWTSMVLLPLYLDHLGASRTQIGTIVAAATIGGLLTRPGVGWALDTLGRRPTLIAGTVVAAGAMLLIGPVDRIGPLVYAARILFGIGSGALFTGYFAFVADIIPPQRRTEGIALFGVSGLLPMSIVPLLERGGIAPEDVQWLLPALAIPVALSIAGLLAVAEPRVERHRSPVRIADVIRAATAPSMWSVWLAVFTFSALVVMFISFASVTGESRGLENPSTLWLTYSIGAVSVRILGARLPDRLGPANVIAPAIAVYVAATLVLATAQSETAFMLAGLLSGIGHGYCFPVLTSQLISRMPARLRGSAMAMFTFLWDFTALTVSPLLGLIADADGDAVMYGTAALAAITCLAAWAVVEHRWSPGRESGTDRGDVETRAHAADDPAGSA